VNVVTQGKLNDAIIPESKFHNVIRNMIFPEVVVKVTTSMGFTLIVQKILQCEF
jgi:hypothetical protein